MSEYSRPSVRKRLALDAHDESRATKIVKDQAGILKEDSIENEI